MKVLILLVAGMFLADSAFGQGTVAFANTASANFRIFTNNGSTGCGPISGVNQWRIGLYVGPLGAPAGGLVLVGLATNAAAVPLAGYFSGGNPFILPNPYASGSPLTFQVRVWAFAGGVSFQEALLNGYSAGASSLGFVTAGGGVTPSGPLFGTSPGQIGGFSFGALEPPGICIPEPSTYALGLLSVALFGLFRRQRH